MSFPVLKLKPRSRARVLRGHPWVFANEVETPPTEARDGETAVLRDSRGHFLGSGIYNSHSQIIWRRFSFDQTDLDPAWLRAAITAALNRRQTGETVGRLIWSESDNLPGLVVDRYGPCLVVQALTLAMDRRLSQIGEILTELLNPEEILFRCDAPVRRKEGLDSRIFTRSGHELQPFDLDIGGVTFRLDLARGQKTGFYLDQRAHYPLVAARAEGKRVLDCFCNQGGFALHAARAGAAGVLGIDSSSEAVKAAAANARANRLEADFAEANVFDFLRRDDRQWDLIILDPPPFAKARGDVEAAFRGYKEIHLRAMKLLAPAGLLATYTCSHQVSQEMLLQIVAGAATDTRRVARVLEFHHQPPDHPVLPVMPESEYLRGLLLEIE